MRICPADGDTDAKRQEARRKRYGRNIESAQSKGLIGVEIVEGGRTLLWLVKSAPTAPDGQDIP